MRIFSIYFIFKFESNFLHYWKVKEKCTQTSDESRLNNLEESVNKVRTMFITTLYNVNYTMMEDLQCANENLYVPSTQRTTHKTFIMIFFLSFRQF